MQIHSAAKGTVTAAGSRQSDRDSVGYTDAPDARGSRADQKRLTVELCLAAGTGPRGRPAGRRGSKRPHLAPNESAAGGGSPRVGRAVERLRREECPQRVCGVRPTAQDRTRAHLPIRYEGTGTRPAAQSPINRLTD
ncbi:hypothetical protein GN956_G4960 [Arapaima gigas]